MVLRHFIQCSLSFWRHGHGAGAYLLVSQRLQVFLHYLNALAALGGVLSKQILLPTRPDLCFRSVAVIRRDDDFDGVLVHSVGDYLGVGEDVLDSLHSRLQFLISPVSVERVSDSKRSHSYSFGLVSLIYVILVVKVIMMMSRDGEKKLKWLQVYREILKSLLIPLIGNTVPRR